MYTILKHKYHDKSDISEYLGGTGDGCGLCLPPARAMSRREGLASGRVRCQIGEFTAL